MGVNRILPGQKVDPVDYFAAYVAKTFTTAGSDSFGVVRRHLINYGTGLLGSAQDAVDIVDEWLAQRGR